MENILPDILSNLLANIIFWIFGGIIFGLVISIRRIRLNRFFGIKFGQPLLIYLSTHPIENEIFKHRTEIENSVDTELISKSEVQVVTLFSELFSSQPFERIADAFAGIVDTLWLIGRPEIKFVPSPLSEEELEFSSTICLGAHEFNTATEYYFYKHNPYIIMERKNPDDRINIIVRINKGDRKGEIITRTNHHGDNEKNWDLGIIVKLFDEEHGNTIFIVAGLEEMGTLSAADYLVENWRVFQKIYNNSEFGICIRCPSYRRNPMGYRNRKKVVSLPK